MVYLRVVGTESIVPVHIGMPAALARGGRGGGQTTTCRFARRLWQQNKICATCNTVDALPS